MSYRCWKKECSQDIPWGEEIWMDADGNFLPKKWVGIPREPSPYHPDCAKQEQEKRLAYKKLNEEHPTQQVVQSGPNKGQMMLF